MTPQELLGLMETSIILTGKLKNTSLYGRPESLALSPETFFKGVDGKDKAIPIYNLKQADTPGAGFKSYVCDYEKGEVNYQVLGREADYCFTITMNGCTFGIGTPAPDGTVLVSHGNQAGVKDGPGVPVGTQHEKQLALAQQLHDPGALFLTPDMYRTGGKENISTFGVWMNGMWNFFYQSYQTAGGGRMKLNGLFPVKTNMLTG